jgi:hypothetical protein
MTRNCTLLRKWSQLLHCPSAHAPWNPAANKHNAQNSTHLQVRLADQSSRKFKAQTISRIQKNVVERQGLAGRAAGGIFHITVRWRTKGYITLQERICFVTITWLGGYSVAQHDVLDRKRTAPGAALYITSAEVSASCATLVSTGCFDLVWRC